MTMQTQWQAPGGGFWEMDDTHLSGASTPVMLTAAGHIMAGLSEAFRRYGVPLEGFDMARVGGRMYVRARPVGAPDPDKGRGPGGPPPKLVMKLLFWLHPELRYRKRRAAAALEQRIWREDARNWHERELPARTEHNLGLQRVALEALDDQAFARHLREAVSGLNDGMRLHGTLIPAHTLPVGRYLQRACELTGAAIGEALEALAGASPGSMEAVEDIDRVVAAIRADDEARELLARDDDASDLFAVLMASGGELQAALEHYDERHGHRLLTGFDIDDRSGGEMPELLIRTLRARCANDEPAAVDAARERAAALRDRVPDQSRDEYDGLLDDAREHYGLQDANVGVTCMWPGGLVRRAMLAAGARLCDRGALAEAEHALEADADELTALLIGQGGPSGDELAQRASERRALSADEVPKSFGERPAKPPLDAFPAAIREMQQAFDFVLEKGGQMRQAQIENSAVGSLSGVGVNAGRYEGVARVVRGPQDFDRIRSGDVLVARLTAPSYNVVLPLLGAVVTDRGGLLCHTAIVAREFGIPAVVGTGEATATIPDGARVRVDGGAGQVTVLA
jgi:pyruvate,water dikinase